MSVTENNEEAGSTLEIPKAAQKYAGLLGNLPDIDGSFPIKSYWELTDLYGPIVELNILGQRVVLVNNYELINDVSDDDRFEKVVQGPLMHVRDQLGDGLFTAHNNEPNWAKAHRVLVSTFGPIGVRKMFDQQMDIASQMILRWDRLGPENIIVAADDFTKLAFDTIGLCSFNYRFNDFYTTEVHPFAQHMADALKEAGKRAARTQLENKLRFQSNQKYWADINAMHKLCDEVLDQRIANPQPEINDLLNVMLSTEDPVTHEKLDGKNIKFQMATFLVAGHETTSGTLSFLFHNLLRHPETYHKAQEEVDRIVGNDALTVQHIPKLEYLEACVKETLRYEGPITLMNRRPKKAIKLAGKYPVDSDVRIVSILKGLHHDHSVWGEDADQFKPERMIPSDKIPPGALRPFGVGMRSCIGRTFAEQEIMITATLILQRFQVELADPNYVMHLKSTLTVKPDGLELKVRRRPGKSDMVGLQAQGQTVHHTQPHERAHTNGAPQRKLTVLYASNAGTCKAYADELVAAASDFDATVRTLDSATENVPNDQPVIVITPSYEGKPADNAKKFVSWLNHNEGSTDLLKGVQYSVFGVGNSEWTATYQKVPKLIDGYFEKFGANRIHDAAFIDVKYDPVGPWEDYLQSLMASLGSESTGAGEVSATITASDTSTALGGPKLVYGTVRENIQIADDSVGPPKRHIEIELPEGLTYRTGDYLTILAHNHSDIIKRVERRFGLKPEDKVAIAGTRKAYLSTSTPISVIELLGTRVELNTPITQKQIAKLAAATRDPKEKESLERLAQDDVYQKEILAKRFSVIDMLEDHPSCEITFGTYLDMLKGMAMRQYSISSSPISPKNFGSNTLQASITYDVHSGGEFAHPDRSFNGVASSYLAALKPGNKVHCTVSSTNVAFHLPKTPETPLIMIAAGTGLAPMRGFIEERAAIAAASGRKVGPALLYFGCRDFEKDYIYKTELEHWESLGAVQLRPVFSKRSPNGTNVAWKYVPDRMWDEREDIAKLFGDGAKIFLCGSASKLAKSTAATCKKIWQEKHPGKSDADADAWLESVKESRYVTDVFG